MQLHYDDGNSELEGASQYNGNISWMEWKTGTDKRQAYGFAYDANNRLTKAIHGVQDPLLVCEYNQSFQYSVPYVRYDALGNIQHLYRLGLQDPLAAVPTYDVIDALHYNYDTSPSLLTSIKEGSDPERGFKGEGSVYGYDGTGNLTSDTGKGISKITYTYNDLPLLIKTDKGTIQNFYTADGLKVKSIVTSSVMGPDGMMAAPETINYIGSGEYKNGKLHAIYFDDGRVVADEVGSPYKEIFLKDHLGNTRARIADKDRDDMVYINPADPENDELMDVMHYYPFGMQWETPQIDVAGNSLEPIGAKTKYTYNGKEMQDDFGIDLQYYGFRMYDPAIGRFTSVDPIAEKFAFVSGFNYAENEPVGHIDLHGLQKKKPSLLQRFANLFSLRETISEGRNPNRTTSAPLVEDAGVDRLKNVAETAKKINDAIDDGLQVARDASVITQDVAGAVETTAITATALTGGASAEVTVPAAAIASGVGHTALLSEAGADMLQDGQLDLDTKIKLSRSALFASIGKLFGFAVDALKIDSPTPTMGKQTSEAVKAQGKGVVKAAKEGTKDDD